MGFGIGRFIFVMAAGGILVGEVLAQGGNESTASALAQLNEQIAPLGYSTTNMATYYFSSDGRRVGFTVRQADRWRVVVDGQAGEEFDEIRMFQKFNQPLVFSEDSQHFAYVARTGWDWRVIVDGQKGPALEDIDKAADVLFSKDFSSAAYLGLQDRQSVVVVGPVAKPMIHKIEKKESERLKNNAVIFSEDGNHFAYVMGTYANAPDQSQQWVEQLNVDGQWVDKRLSVDLWRFSPDGSQLAYSKIQNVQADGYETQAIFVQIGKQEFGPYQYVDYSGVRFSQSGKRFALIARPIPRADAQGQIVEDGAWLMSNDRKWGPYANINSESMTFSPDGEHVAFVAERLAKDSQSGKRRVVVHEGREIGPYADCAPQLTFSPDSSRLGFVAFLGGADSAVVVVDGKNSKTYQRVDNPIFSPDSKRYAFSAVFDRKALVVVDGQQGPPEAEISRIGPVFSSDSKHYAYVSMRQNKCSLVLDGRPVAAFETYFPGLQELIFSLDSQHVLCKGDAQVFVNGVPSKYRYQSAGRLQLKSDREVGLLGFYKQDHPNQTNEIKTGFMQQTIQLPEKPFVTSTASESK